MKISALVFFIILSIISSSGFAETANFFKGQVGQQKPLPDFTDQQLEEALRISDDCKADTIMSTRYECDCVGMTYLELRRKRGDNAQSYWLREDANQKCPNRIAMAGKMYTDCKQKSVTTRVEDYEEFCTCYGTKFANYFGKNPTSNLNVFEGNMIRSMVECNVNSVNQRSQEREMFVDRLKERGIYDKLFPGADGVEFKAQ